jgi:hypothetical protein
MREKSVIQQRIENFEQRHGGRKVAVLSTCGGYWLYPDGARRDVNPEGLLEDLPELRNHPYRGNQEALDLEILNRRVSYHAAKVANRDAAFYRQRESMTHRDYDNSQWQVLERIGKLVSIAKREMEVVLDELHAHPQFIAQQTALEQQATAQARIAEKARKLDKMRV